jgi:hypothetical protein
MTIAFRQETIRFDATKNRAQREPFTATFPRRVRTAEAVLKGFNIGFTDKDHHIFRQEVDIDVGRISNNTVEGFVDFLLRDSSGNIDDRYDGWVQLIIIADLA